jgi:hypothetical protein
MNLMRASESAVLVHASFSDRSEDEEAPRKSKNKKNDKPETVYPSPKNEKSVHEQPFLQTASTLCQVENSSSEASIFLPSAKTPTIRSASSIPRGTSELEGSGVVPQRSRTRLVKTKSSRGTVTDTTSKGLSPLDGIHAGVGVGPEYCDTFFDDEDSLNAIYNLHDSEDEREKDMAREKVQRLVVPSSIVFEASCGQRHSYRAILKIHNISEYFVTFCVKPSESEMFVITPSIGMLGPCSNQEVFVKTNPRFEFTFKDIASEVFKIFATPVYTRSQMKPEKLHVLWRAFGSNLFPRIAAEEHTINFVYQYFPKYTTESLLSAISCNHRWLNSIRGNTKEVPIKPNQISEEEFYSVWPLEDDQYNFMTCKNQIDGWYLYLRNMKKETRLLKYEMRQCLGNCVLFLFISVLVYSSFYPVPPTYKMPSYFDMFNWLRIQPEEKCQESISTPFSYWDLSKKYFGF